MWYFLQGWILSNSYMLFRIFKNQESPFKLRTKKFTVFQLDLIQGIVAEVNTKTGEAECQFYRRGLSYLEESQRLPEIQLSRFLYCHGELKSTKGQVASLGHPHDPLSALVHLTRRSHPQPEAPRLPLRAGPGAEQARGGQVRRPGVPRVQAASPQRPDQPGGDPRRGGQWRQQLQGSFHWRKRQRLASWRLVPGGGFIVESINQLGAVRKHWEVFI